MEYRISEAVRDEMARDEPAVKSALCKIANARFGRQDEPPMGIFKDQGGIRVNDREIAIQAAWVQDDWPRSCKRDGRNPTPEEEATVAAISAVADFIEAHGMEKLAGTYGRCTQGSPLRKLLKGYRR